MKLTKEERTSMATGIQCKVSMQDSYVYNTEGQQYQKQLFYFILFLETVKSHFYVEKIKNLYKMTETR